MIIKTNGIVLKYLKYKESSIICKIYTESHGLQSFIVNGVRSSKSSQLSIYQPLNQLNLILYKKNNSTLNRIKELKISKIYKSLHADISKISICFFLSEFLSKVLSSEEDQISKFKFISESILYLDKMKNSYNDFHIKFLIKLSNHFGFGIYDGKQLQNYSKMDPILIDYINKCINNNYDFIIKSNNNFRNNVINLIIEYYRINLDINLNIKSNDVLQQIFK
tara:strand:+ start:1486 stop:2151 length:666 start_codon:yes stop_codon:yes gene_type:complete